MLEKKFQSYSFCAINISNSYDYDILDIKLNNINMPTDTVICR